MKTRQIRVYGIVQGVGFRPTMTRLATEYGITGTVCNKGPYVEIIASGKEDNLHVFTSAITKQAPERAVILRVEVEELECAFSYADFSIIESGKTKGDIFISPDIAICPECKKELFDPNNKRYLHPFINCTCCGPRLTILDTLPYDRERTSMKKFEMCPECAAEYYDDTNRRFDAQPVCCNDCGPVVYRLDEDDASPDRKKQSSVISEARRTLANGGIVAVKGIGGYHLCCDATNEKAVSLLRMRKKRPMKPFAVMAKDLETAKRYCEISAEQEEILTGYQKPIVLLQKRYDCALAASVAPKNPKAGLMLPYAPIQLLLFDYEDEVKMPDVLVMTSANESGTPICHNEAEALEELTPLADYILANNRDILIRADDSVMDFYDKMPYMIRRSRGYAPLPFLVKMDESKETQTPRVVIGIGGELKNSFCVRVGKLCYLSPYIGDMEDERTIDALKESLNRFLTMLEVQPEAVIYDLHPNYNTSMVARSLGIPAYSIQHHYAHVLACMAENHMTQNVIGVSFDGTGYGEDKSIWGGEILRADLNGFERAASIEPFLQIGGNASAKEGWRIAVSMIYGLAKSGKLSGIEGFTEGGLHPLDQTIALANELSLCTSEQADVLSKMYDGKMNAVPSTSAGRLFDAASAILGIRRESTFEGEASCALMYAAEAFKGISAYYKKDIKKDGRIYLPTDELILDLIQRKLCGEATESLAFYFHYALSQMIGSACEEVRDASDINTVALTGGCFQNTLLLSLTEERLKESDFVVIRHKLVPPNDGGIALGQSVYTGFVK